MTETERSIADGGCAAIRPMVMDLDPLTDVGFTMRAYASASDSWLGFLQNGSPEALRSTAATLAGALAVLGEDPAFFAALRTVVTGVEDVRGSMPDDLRQQLDAHVPLAPTGNGTLAVDRVLSREVPVLMTAGMQPAHAVRLVTDLSRIVPDGTPVPADAAMARMHSATQALAAELGRAERVVAMTSEPGVVPGSPTGAPLPTAPRHRAWAQALRTTAKGLGAVAGAATVAANAAAAIASFGVLTGLGLGSVLVGAEALSRSVAGRLDGNDPG